MKVTKAIHISIEINDLLKLSTYYKNMELRDIVLLLLKEKIESLRGEEENV
jgi:hypothetical protein